MVSLLSWYIFTFLVGFLIVNCCSFIFRSCHPGDGELLGYRRNLLGTFLYVIWMVLPGILAICVYYKFYRLKFNPNEHSYNSEFSEAYACLCLSVGLMITFWRFPHHFRCLFLLPCDLRDATHVFLSSKMSQLNKVVPGDPPFFESYFKRYYFDGSTFVPGQWSVLSHTEYSGLVAGTMSLGDTEERLKRIHGPNLSRLTQSRRQKILEKISGIVPILSYFTITSNFLLGDITTAFFWGFFLVAANIRYSLSTWWNTPLPTCEKEFYEIIRSSLKQKRVYTDILPYDTLVIHERMQIPGDCILITGKCVVDESQVTGEVAGVEKGPWKSREPMPLSIIQGDLEDPTSSAVVSRHILRAGSTVLEAESPVLAVVCGISGMSTTGRHLQEKLEIGPSFIQRDILGVYGILAVCCCLAWWIRAYFRPYLSVNFAEAIDELVDPSLVLGVLNLETTEALWLLNFRYPVESTQPERLHRAGATDVVVFDKTGVLTQKGMTFISYFHWADHGMVPYHLEMYDRPKGISLMALLGCHSVVKLSDSYVGHSLEVAVIEALKCELLPNGRIHDPVSGLRLQQKVIHRFSHTSLVSGASVLDEKSGDSFVFVKGAPEVILDLCSLEKKEVIWEKIEDLLNLGYYVLGMAYEKVDPTSIPDFLAAQKEFLGIVIFQNPVRSEGLAVINELSSADVHTIVCSGDSLSNVIVTAREVQILGSPTDNAPKVLIATTVDLEWRSGLHVYDHEYVMQNHSRYQLVASNLAFLELIRRNHLVDLLPYLRALGRMQPSDKAKLVEYLKEQPTFKSVLFVGDGPNDFAAISKADVGVAFGAGCQGIKAHFWSSASNLRIVPQLIQSGVRFVATRNALICVFSVNVISSTFYLTTVSSLGQGHFPDFGFVLKSLLVVLTMGCMSKGGSQPLSKERPPPNVFNWDTLKRLLVFLGSSFGFAWFSYDLLREEDYFVPGDGKHLGISVNEWLHHSQNYESAVFMLYWATSTLVAGLVWSLGGHFGSSIFQNYQLILLLTGAFCFYFYLVLGGPSPLHCAFDMNCDQFHSLRAWYNIEFLKGRCFLGPQLILLDSGSPRTNLAEFLRLCRDKESLFYENQMIDLLNQTNLKLHVHVPGCTLPHNCFGSTFSQIYIGLFIFWVCSMLVFNALLNRRKRRPLTDSIRAKLL